MINEKDLVDAIQAIADEKGISKDIVAEGIEEGFKKAFERFFDTEANTEVDIDMDKGSIKMYLLLNVVQKVDDDWLEIGINDAKKEFGDDVKIGDVVKRPVDFTHEFSRLAVRQVRQNLQQRLRATERERIYDEFIGRNHELLTGKVTGMNEQGNAYLLEVEDAVVSLWSNRTIPGDKFHIGDFVQFYVEDVKEEDRYSQIQASRTAPGFLQKLIEAEVPEVAEGIIEIKGVSREAGKRAKVAVSSVDPNVEPIGAIVGPRGSRINRVSDQLHGEKIDVVNWSANTDEFIMNAMAPVRVVSVDVDEENNEVDVIVPNEQLSLAIGRGGMAARLVANLIRMKINIISLDQAKELGITNFWNGNITEQELTSPEFLENITRRTKKARTTNQGFNNGQGSRTRAPRGNTMQELEDELAKFQSELQKDNEQLTSDRYESDDETIDDAEEVEDKITKAESSLDEIQANIEALEEANKDDDDIDDNEDDIIDDDYDKYYEDK